MNVFSNPWIVGIGGGIISGLVVTYMLRLIFSKRDDREYAQKISTANHEVLYAVRPGISEKVIPTNNVLNSLIEATARKYSVNVTDMYDLNDVSSELIKEVMDSSFISASAKQEFCQKLTIIKKEDDTEKTEFEREYDISSRYRRQLIGMIAAMASVLTALAGVMVTLDNSTVYEPRDLLLITIPAIVAVLISVVAVIIKDLQKIRLKSLNINVGGVNAKFKSDEEIK